MRHKDELYAMADGRGLSGTDRSPPTHEWVDDGTSLMRGSTYIHAIKTRFGVLSKNYKVLKEPSIQTSAGLRKPDVIIWDRQQSVVLDVQIVSDSSAGDILDHAHGLKRSYYDTGEIRAWALEQTGSTPVFTTLTMNLRGIMATPSYLALKSLKLTKAELRLLAVRGMEGFVATLRAHRDIGG
ncbi:uncharacterized protein LOC135094311 [Scylla paramamosain]|uniref:uncharacterized protein LOC135094311 n=1 Tax=Scylla paramamosain TaxID=85552 RepID=UPI003082EF20